MAAPAVLAAIAATKTVGGLVGGIGQYKDTQRGMSAYQNLANAGSNELRQGKAGSDTAYQPYTQAGSTGVAGQTAGAKNYLNAVGTGPQAGQYQTTPQGTQAYLDPSAAYSTDQANRAMQASALAKGGVGGGLARALSNNANKMAMTNYNNAFQQQMGANQQNFGLANQQFQNNFNAQNQNMQNYQNLANMGMQATQGNQANQLAYNQGISNNYINQADAQQSGWNAKGQIFNNTAAATANNVTGGIGSIFGGK